MISVLSAVEGLEVATPVFKPYIVPITIGILVGLFLIQRHGTERVGRLFGPVTLLWFALSAVLGAMHVVRAPQVFAAINPLYGARFFVENGYSGFLVLGSVFLVVTGGEALYADMGHFGRKPIRHAWYCVVLPALLRRMSLWNPYGIAPGVCASFTAFSLASTPVRSSSRDGIVHLRN